MFTFSLPSDHPTPITIPGILNIVPPPINKTESGQLLSLPKFNHEIGFRVLSACANAAVVKLFSATDGRGLTDQALVRYIRLHHMLLYLAERDSAWRLNANKQIDRFLEKPEYRRKQHVPDLGRFLIYLLVADREWSPALANAFLEESLARQVSWFMGQGLGSSTHGRLLPAREVAEMMSDHRAPEPEPELELGLLRPHTPALPRRRALTDELASVSDATSVASNSARLEGNDELKDILKDTGITDKLSEELAYLETDSVSVYRLKRTFEVSDVTCFSFLFFSKTDTYHNTLMIRSRNCRRVC
jgi:hypothetical protein